MKCVFFWKLKKLNISNEYFHDFCHEFRITFHPCSEKNRTVALEPVNILSMTFKRMYLWLTDGFKPRSIATLLHNAMGLYEQTSHHLCKGLNAHHY